MSLDLILLAEKLAVCRLPAGTPLPDWAASGVFSSVSWTPDETSVVCEQAGVPAGVQAELDWRAFRVAGAMEFTLTGILLSIAQPLADAGVGIFAVSTYDTDYVLVKEASLESAVTALTAFGHNVVRAG